MWGAIKYALNSTLATDKFKPLDKHITAENYDLCKAFVRIAAFYADANENAILIIPWSETKIEAGKYATNLQIESVIMPSSIRTIEDGAFADCVNLKQILLPENLASIGADAFKNCTELTSVTISSKFIEDVDGSAFEDCAKISKINYNGTKEEWASSGLADKFISSLGYTVYCTNGELTE